MHLESPECVSSLLDGEPVLYMDLVVLSKEKAEILNKEGYVTLIGQLASKDDIGGLYALKDWMESRKKGFSDDAEMHKVRPPRGVVLVGPPGTAKSTCARLFATVFGMPLIRLDVGALFNSMLGNSERNLRNALQVADASSPCILWLDEVALSAS
jgi:SpoVK/Ycf46/Vps4 family AAA+-type ATPase